MQREGDGDLNTERLIIRGNIGLATDDPIPPEKHTAIAKRGRLENQILEWAEKYRKHNMSVIPVGEDKKPLVDWKEYQTKRADGKQIIEWFDKENPPNIGIVTGKISGITVVDVEEGGVWKDLPQTATTKTGGGGYHLYYKYAEGVGNSTRIRELTDIRGDGGFVVAPPSGHLSGGKYEWFKKESFQPFPYDIFGVKVKEKTDWHSVIKGIEKGGRNTTASKVVGKLIKTFTPNEWGTTVWEILVMWNQNNTPPLGERELRAVFNSITGTALRSGDHKKEEIEEEVGIKLISEIAKDLTDDLSVSYPTGYPVYDKAFMGGLKEGDLVVLSGFSGHGKTHLAQSMTYNLVNQGHPCLWFSYEVTVGELWRKFKEMGVQDSFLAYSPEKLVNQRIDFVVEKVIEARDTFKTKIIFIDHLGFLASDPANYDNNLSNNYATQLTMICRKLKRMAIAENVVVVLLAHLKKPVNPTAEPSYHDLKDSSGVAQEADSVLLINRQRETTGYGSDEVYGPESKVKIEKNRRTGQTKVFNVEMVNGVLLDSERAFDRQVDNVLSMKQTT